MILGQITKSGSDFATEKNIMTIPIPIAMKRIKSFAPNACVIGRSWKKR
jgi:hypothetical protein